MRARLIGLLSAAVVGVGLLAAPAAQAATNSAGGITVYVPSTRTAYNGGTAIVKPAVTLTTGTQKVVTARTIYAARSGRLVGSGTYVRLRAGSYAVRTRVTYRSYSYVTRTRTVTERHEGGMPDGSRCTVTAVDSYGDVAFITAADCVNAAYPGQVVSESYPLLDEDPTAPQVGDVYGSDYISFQAYDSTRQERYRVRSYAAARAYTTPWRSIKVVNGGNRRVFDDSGSLTTPYFSVPKGHMWRAYYSYDCGDYASNWIVWRHRKGTASYTDELLANQIKRAGSGRYVGGGGTYRFALNTGCEWSISVYWR